MAGQPRGLVDDHESGVHADDSPNSLDSPEPLPHHVLLVGHIEAMAIGHVLPDGRELFADVSFRVGEGARVALVGPNGAGKTTLLRMVAGEISPATGSIARTGGLGVMSQFVGAPTADDRTLADLALSLAPPPVRGRPVSGCGRPRRRSTTPSAARSATPTRSWRGARRAATWRRWPSTRRRSRCSGCRGTRRSAGASRRCRAASRSGSRWRLLLRGPDEVLLLDEPDNYLDVPGKRWLEDRLRDSPKSVLYVSHDRELLARTAHRRSSTVEAGSAWTHPEGFASWYAARVARHARSTSCAAAGTRSGPSWRRLVVYPTRSRPPYNDDMASRLPGRAHPAERSSRRPGRRRRRARQSSRSACSSAAPAPASAPWCAKSWSSTG